MRISDWSSDVCSSDLTPEPPACGLTWTTIGSVITFVITLKVPSMTSLTLTRIGNSVGVVLPKDVLARLRLGEGDALYLTDSPDVYRLTPYDPEFERQTPSPETVMRANGDVLRPFPKMSSAYQTDSLTGS